MDARGEGLPKNEALLALAKAVGNRWRATGDDHFTITAQPYPREGLIAVSAYYPNGSPLAVLTPITVEGWNSYVETQLTHEFITVCQKRIDLEKFMSDYIDAKVKGVADAYR